MDAFEALLQATPAKPAPAADPFAALMAQPVERPKAKPKSEPVKERPGVGSALTAGTADVVDLLVTGLFAMPVAGVADAAVRATPAAARTIPAVGPVAALGAAGRMAGRKLMGEDLQAGEEFATVMGGGRKATGARAQRMTETASKALAQPARDVLRYAGILPEDYESATDRGMAWIMDKAGQAGEAVEERTGGAVTKDDVMSLVTYSFGLMGVKATQVTVKAGLDRAKAKEALKELNAFAQEKQGLNTLEAEADASKALAPVDAATNAAARATAAIAPEGVGKSGGTPGVAFRVTPERRAELKAMRTELRARFAEDHYEPARPDSPQAEAARVRQQADRMPAEGQRFEMPKGYGPDPTMDWLRGGAAVGVGLGSLYALSQDNPEVAAAMAAGAFVVKGGKGLTLKALQTMPDATPLGRILDQSAYTLSTLEMLPKNRFEFRKDSVAQFLKRDSVTKAERTILQDVLDSTPGDTITAKELMLGIKTRTGDFELKAQATDQFGDYGLERIDRAGSADPDVQTLPEMRDELQGNIAQLRDEGAMLRERAAADEAVRFPDYPFAPRQAGQMLRNLEERIRNLPEEIAEAEKLSGRNLEPTTTIYQSPVELGTANHFRDPNYFAHTRSFTEGGVKHVVELQSDVAQKAKIETITPEMREAITRSNEVQTGAKRFWDSVQYATSRAGNYSFFDGLRSVKKNAADLETAVGHGDIPMMIEEKLLRNLNEAGQGGASLANKFYQEWAVGKTPTELQNYARGHVDISDGFIDWALKHEREFTPPVEDALRGVLNRYAASKLDSVAVILQENAAKLQVGNAAAISPMLKDWHKRLVREELASAAREVAEAQRLAADYRRQGQEGLQIMRGERPLPPDGQPAPAAAWQKFADDMEAEALRVEKSGAPVVRFADADTVAKVEGWAEESTTAAAKRAGMQDVWERDYEVQAPRTLRQHENKLRSEAKGDAEALAKIPRQMETAAANTKKARKYGKLFKSPDHAGLYIFYKEDVTKFLKQLGGTDKADSAGHGWWEVPVEGSKSTPAGRRVQQFGGLDADLAKAVAAIGGGAWIASILSDPENKAKNAAWTAAILSLGMFAKSRITGLDDMAESAGRRLENAGGKISLELRNINQALGRRLLEFDADEMVQTAVHTKTIAPFVKSLHKAGAAGRGHLNDAILTGKSAPVLAALAKLGKPEIIQQWKTVRALLEDLGKGLIDAGRLKQLLSDYYPRMVIDYPGLSKALGVEARTYLEAMIEKANLKSLREKGTELSPLDLSLVVNKYLERAVNGQGKPGFLKRRSIEEITAELSPFYAPAMESLPLYIRAVVKEIERAKFFGKDLMRDPESGAINLDTSIGNLVNRELAAGRIKPEQMQRVKDLLHSRFGPGEQASSRSIQAFRNINNALLLGDIFNALRNLGDIGPIWAMYDGLTLIKGAISMITRRPERITAADMGLAKHLAEEFVHGTRRPVMFKVPLTDKQIQISTARFADQSFKLGGFRFLDVGMKELAANTALHYYQAAVKKPKALAEFRRSYGEFFGKDFDALVADLQAKRSTRLTRLLATRELADLQPLFKSEMSKFYNDHPDARVLYQLKTFTLSQLNLLRSRGFDEIRQGNTRRGTEFLLRYLLLAGLTGMTVDNLIRSLLGRDTSWDLSDLPVYAMKNFGYSQYALEKLRSGKPVEAITAVAAPPLQPIWDVLTGDPEAVRYAPVVGEVIYSHGMGGSDKANYLERQREKREARDAADPEAAAARRKKARDAFKKRVEKSAKEPRP